MLFKNIVQPTVGAGFVIKDAAKIVAANPKLLLYIYAVPLFTGVTYSLISLSVLHNWYNRIFSTVDTVALHSVGNIVGIVGFSAFYAALVSAYFTCAVSADVLAKLEHRQSGMFAGLRLVGRHFIRVTIFAFLSVFLFPMGVWAQRRKLPKGIVGVVGSSLTLHMAQMAPAILTTHQPMGSTVRDSVNTLGKFWREGLVLKVGMYTTIFLIVVLPKLIQHGFFHGRTASNISWLISLELATSGYVIFKVINAIFTAVLYHQAKNKE